MAFLRNFWYVAAWADEVGRSPFRRKLLNEDVVLYRTEQGEPVALSNRCPHRFAPMHLGRLVGDYLQCRYHSLGFDRHGTCVLNPNGNNVCPKAARLKSYPVVDRDDLIWIWMGDPDRAELDQVPREYDYLVDETSYRLVKSSMTIKANYQLVTDNLLDQAHAASLHDGSLGSDAIMRAKTVVRREGARIIHADRWCPDGLAPPLLDMMFDNYGLPVDHWINQRWEGPCLLSLDVGITPTGRPRVEGISFRFAHILTPETETSTHYFWGMCRDFKKTDQMLDRIALQTTERIFVEEDEWMLEAVQENMRTPDLWGLNPILLESDAAAVVVRRAIEALLAEEAACAAGAPQNNVAQ